MMSQHHIRNLGSEGETSLVYYALIPESPVQDQITAFKLEAAQRFGTLKALNSPAHLTLIPPRRLDALALDRYDEVVRQVSDAISAFSLACQGFAAFPPRVIYVHVLANEDLLNLNTRIWEQLYRSGLTARQEGPRFHPHMTVAFRDLNPQQYAVAWPFFQNQSYQAEWQAEGVWRLLHRGGRWERQAFFPFIPALSVPAYGST
jgi:2'-5' RNA ligase